MLYLSQVHIEISFKGTKANQRPPEKATLELTKFMVNSQKKLKKSLKLTTHIFGAITDKLLSVWCCLFFSGIAGSCSSLRQQNFGRPISFQVQDAVLQLPQLHT